MEQRPPLHLGVLVGKHHGPDHHAPLGPSTSFAKQLSQEIRKKGGEVFFFSLEHVDLNQKRIQGLSYKTTWETRSFPFPPVIYNRLLTRTLEQHPRTKRIIGQLKQQHKTIIFNEKYLDKHDVFRALTHAQPIRKYLPLTAIHHSSAQLEQFCRRFHTVFLKPIRGSLGLGIIRIQKQQNGLYHLHRTTTRANLIKENLNLHQLEQAIRTYTRKQKHQIQQGIPLLRRAGKPVDFRALMHKAQKGKWCVTSIVARIGGAGQIVSNIARGGRVTQARTFLSKKAYTNLKHTACAIATATDAQITGTFGELGIDLAIDKHGRIWLIEVNSKPAKNDKTILTRTRTRPSVRNLVQVVRYFAKEAYK